LRGTGFHLIGLFFGTEEVFFKGKEGERGGNKFPINRALFGSNYQSDLGVDIK